MGRLCGERGTAQALRASAGRKKRVSPHPAPKHPEVPRAPAPAAASRSQPTAAHPAPSPSLPRIYPRIYVPRPGRCGCLAARARSCRSRRAPAPAAASRPPPTPYLRRPFRSYILGYTSLSPGRFGCPAARVRSCRSRRVPPSRPPKGARGKRPLPRRKTSAGADLFRRPYLGTTAFFIPLTLSMAYRTASMVWLSWSGYRGRTRPLRSRSYS